METLRMDGSRKPHFRERYSIFLSRFHKLINALLLASLLAFYHTNLVDKDFTPFERDIFFVFKDSEIRILKPVYQQESIRYRHNEFSLSFVLPGTTVYQVAIRFHQELYLPIHVFMNSEKVVDLTTTRVKEGLYETIFTVKPEKLHQAGNLLQFFGTGLKPENMEFVSIQNFRGGNKKFPELYITFEKVGSGLLENFQFQDFGEFFLVTCVFIFGMTLLLTLVFPLSNSEAFELVLNSYLPCLILLTLILFSYYAIPYRIHLPELTFFVIAFYLSFIVLTINMFFQYRERVYRFMQGKKRWRLISALVLVLLSIFIFRLL